MDKNQKLAQDIFSVLRPEDVVSVLHCTTRLRLHLQAGCEVPQKDLEKINGVRGVVKTPEGCQIIIGTNVDKVYAAALENHPQLKETAGGQVEADPKDIKADLRKKNPFQAVLGAISAIVAPVVPAVIASGLVSALITVLSLAGVDGTSTSMTYLNMLGNVGLYFLPFFLAYSSAKYFNVSPVMALFTAGILMHPTVAEMAAAESAVTLFMIPVYKASYASTLIPVILSVWALKYVHGFFRKVIPDVLSYVFVPLLTVLVMLPVTLCVTGPAGSLVGMWLSEFVLWMLDKAPGLGVIVLSCLTAPMVLTGSHLALIPLVLGNFSAIGYDNTLMAAFVGWNFSLFAVALAVAFKTRKASLRGTALSCAITAGLSGVTEPSLYSICLRLKKPLYAVILGNVCNGIVCAVLNVKEYSFGAPCFLTLVNYIDPNGSANFVYTLITVAVVCVVTFGATWILGWDESDFD